MARKSSSQLSLVKIGLTILVIALAGALVIHLTSQDGSKKQSVKNTIPVEEYSTLGSSLRDNEYTLYGKLENRETMPNGELVTLVVQKEAGGEERLPIIVPQEAKSINLERDQSYYFDVKVQNQKDAKGLLVAKKISQ